MSQETVSPGSADEAAASAAAASTTALALIAGGAPLKRIFHHLAASLSTLHPALPFVILARSADGLPVQLWGGATMPADYLAALAALPAFPAVRADVDPWRERACPLAALHGWEALAAWPLHTADGRVNGLLLVHRAGDRALPADWRAPFDQVALLATIALERELTANRLCESEARRAQLEMAIEGSATGIWDRNLQSGEINYSDSWKALLGYRPSEISNRIEDAYPRLHPDDLEFVKATIQAHVDGKTNSYRVEHRIRCKDGSYKWISSRGRIVEWDGAGRPLRMIGATTDITERKRVELELQEFATTDFLTGLANRRHFMERMENELGRIKRLGGARAAVLMCDLDHFKQVNDRHGHATGDAALRHFAAVLCATMRKIDIAGRVGGEEFAVLLPEAGEEDGYFLAQRLQRELAMQPFRNDASDIPMTASIGITALCATDSDAGNALSRSDHALYRAKREGRNRIEIERS